MMKLIDEKFIKFVLVGILNTLVGTAIMFTLYNIAHLGYWFSSAINYTLTSIMSFFLNKYFTFKSKGNLGKEVIKFSVNIAICYVLAYALAKPLTYFILNRIFEGTIKANIIENVAMLVGMGFFVVFNYTGQRFFAFKAEE
ncbi:MAG: GtrA family protein [Clostridia bacterium]